MRILYKPDAYSQQRQREKKSNIYPVRMAMEAQFYRHKAHEVHWISPGMSWADETWAFHKADKIIKEPEGIPFHELPWPNRVFTRAKDYTSGNYKFLPGTHIMSASGCWWGKCTFCVEKGEPYYVRRVPDIIDELKDCQRLGFREVFDDAATFPLEILDDFCKKLKPLDLTFSCNMRCVDLDYKKMKDAGFRMLLFGVESFSDYTLDRINKGITYKDFRYIANAAKAGLEPHVAVMFGYPWETNEEALDTLHLVHYLLKKGYAKTAQASFYQTPYQESDESHRKYVKKIYDVGFSPEFWFNRLKSIRNIDDIKYIWRGIKCALKS
jgi:anaerobic magnesium-protoporphyrin IX monomethyl ester cyclase